MARYSVYRAGKSYVVDCQADLLARLRTRFVIPLMPLRSFSDPAPRLNPVFTIDGEPFVLATQFAASMPVAELTTEICSLEAQDRLIMNALDMLITGY